MSVKECEHLSGLEKEMCEIEHMTKLIGNMIEKKAEDKQSKANSKTEKANKAGDRATKRGERYE
ncbi:hypothetical protein [Cysteiniphilum halobium]|uniref:hypothetical protein n=1 Tax=Cysteiniphilum halobium TaxID=2219059 RepID=UPI003F852939